MKWTLILACIVLINQSVLAQEKKSYKIKAGQELSDVLSFGDIYKYPSFKQSIVLFLNGNEGNGLLNYNFLNGEMEFISATGDTVALDDERTIKKIWIDEDTFYFDKGYMNVIAGYGTKKLAKKQLLGVVDKKNLGAFDFPVSAGTENYGIYKNVKLKAKADIIMMLEDFYYLGDRQNFYPFNKKNLLKVYKRKESAITNFLNEQSIDFSNENDLRKLFNYLKNIDV